MDGGPLTTEQLLAAAVVVGAIVAIALWQRLSQIEADLRNARDAGEELSSRCVALGDEVVAVKRGIPDPNMLAHELGRVSGLQGMALALTARLEDHAVIDPPEAAAARRLLWEALTKRDQLLQPEQLEESYQSGPH